VISECKFTNTLLRCCASSNIVFLGQTLIEIVTGERPWPNIGRPAVLNDFMRKEVRLLMSDHACVKRSFVSHLVCFPAVYILFKCQRICVSENRCLVLVIIASPPGVEKFNFQVLAA